MHTCATACAPERLRALKKIFDVTWLVEILTGARRPTVALGDEIARGMAEHAGDVEVKPGDISQAILSALEAKAEPSLPTFLLTKFPAASRNLR
jgi:hypothetical protein